VDAITCNDPVLDYNAYDAYKLDPSVKAVLFTFSPAVTFPQLGLASLYINELKLSLLVTDDTPSKDINGRKYP
jgi:hypothetical protein